ncbi:MAG: isoprenylcysteine carboxylmethyltransferase family protein [Candidatus Eremiobacteraeota bacterium]|nr:isoprenylcysteine carboxylmethyltransferase family protein [Candidatus Eremiobacteraeota bacterium]
MSDARSDELQAFVFKNRGALLAVPAVALAFFGKPSAFGITVGLPVAFAGELIRCWAVGYSGVTTRGDRVTAPKLVSAGPYAHVRNPLYLGNFLTALGFGIAFTGGNASRDKTFLLAASLGFMGALYATIVPHEEGYLQSQFGAEFERYCERVPSIVPLVEPAAQGLGEWDAAAIPNAESRTFVTFGVMLAVLAIKARKASP